MNEDKHTIQEKEVIFLLGSDVSPHEDVIADNLNQPSIKMSFATSPWLNMVRTYIVKEIMSHDDI